MDFLIKIYKGFQLVHQDQKTTAIHSPNSQLILQLILQSCRISSVLIFNNREKIIKTAAQLTQINSFQLPGSSLIHIQLTNDLDVLSHCKNYRRIRTREYCFTSHQRIQDHDQQHLKTPLKQSTSSSFFPISVLCSLSTSNIFNTRMCLR